MRYQKLMEQVESVKSDIEIIQLAQAAKEHKLLQQYGDKPGGGLVKLDGYWWLESEVKKNA